MRFSFRHPAGDQQRFASNAFDSQVGRQVPLTAGDDAQRIGTATLVSALVNGDGSDVELTYEVADESTATGFVKAGFRGSLSPNALRSGPRGSTLRRGSRVNLSLPPAVRENGAAPRL
ncbi:MAG TPA: hypothetical protein VJT31_21690 [Rugosimonospora sp.]|nr:hypothetical protein [Rugosimonospora sp.]